MNTTGKSLASFFFLSIILAGPAISCSCSSDNNKVDTPPEVNTDTTATESKQNRNCMTDLITWMYNSSEIIQKRFDLYKKMGVNVLRVEFDWSAQEYSEGSWKNEDQLYTYLQRAKDNGFRIKLILGIMSDPPSWFIKKHPETVLVSQNGHKASGAVSYWYPDIENMYTEVMRKMISILKEKDLWDVVDFVCPSLGSAGEPIYPALWTQPSMSSQEFWCYADNAKADFRRAMKEKYSTIEAANSVWSSSFATWNDVTVLKPGEKKGAYWNDVLTWYRDTKRDKVRKLLDIVSTDLSGTGKKLVIHTPGVQYKQSQWTAALSSSTGGASNLMTMEDSDYLLDYAGEKGAMIEYTGLTPGEENVAEIARLKKYVNDKGFNVDIWAENVGDEWTASRIEALKNLVISNRLYGFDYTHSIYLFQDDKVTPKADMVAALTELYSEIDALYK